MKTKDWRAWAEPLLAGLPHLFFVLALGGHALAARQILSWVFFGLIVAALVFAGTQRWPRWSASWIGYGLVMAQLASLGPGSGRMATGQVASGIPFFWANLILVILVFAAVLISLLLARRDRLSGLLMVLPAVPVLWSVLALDAVRARVTLPLSVAVGLATALLAGWMARTKRSWTGVGVALAVNVLLSLSMAYVTTYHAVYKVVEPSITDMMTFFIFNLIASSVLITGPVWGWELLERIWRQITERIRGTR